jgi:hypothetical protein
MSPHKVDRFCLHPAFLPTYHNIAYHLSQENWRSTSFKWRAHFSDKHFQFDTQAAASLEFKHYLASLVSEYCPDVMPVTYSINDDNALSLIQSLESDPIWILKPALQNNGQNIKIFQNLEQLRYHYLNPNRLGGEHVLQHYITSPHLLQGPQKGHKYSIRLFVVLTNYAGAYVYSQGYFNVALNPYDGFDFSDLAPHLTNEHLKGHTVNVAQIPSQQYARLFGEVYPLLKKQISSVISGLHQRHPEAFVCKKHRALAIFGFDFMVDSRLRVWLLEANHGPCFPVNLDHPLQEKLYIDFWKNFITSFVYPIAREEAIEAIQYAAFEKML